MVVAVMHVVRQAVPEVKKEKSIGGAYAI